MKNKETAYRFTNNWFAENESIWDTYLKDYKNKDHLSYLEIGVYEGRSFFWMLDHVLTGNHISATVIDPFFIYRAAQNFHKNLELCEKKTCVTLYKGIAHEILKKFDDHSFDIIYIDGSHKTCDVIHDLIMSWNLLKEGGILLLDDYVWQADRYPINLRPQLAIDSFLAIYGDELELLYKGWSIVIRKKKDPVCRPNSSLDGFTTDRLTANEPSRSLLNNYKDKDHISYLEIGALKGDSFFWMLENILTGNRMNLVAFYPFDHGDAPEVFYQKLNASAKKEAVTLYKGRAHEVLKKFADDCFDIIYIDGSNQAHDVFRELIFGWNLLKKDGLLLIDGYFGKEDEVPGDRSPKLAIDSFITIHADELELLHKESIVFIRKKNNPIFVQDFSYINNNIYFWFFRSLFRMVKKFDNQSYLQIFYSSKTWFEATLRFNKTSELSKIRLKNKEKRVLERYLRTLEFGQGKPDESKLTEQDLKIWNQLKQKIE